MQRRFDVPAETVLLPGEVTLTPVIIEPRFTDGNHFRRGTHVDDPFKRHFRMLIGHLVLGMQCPGAVKKPGIGPHQVGDRPDFLFFAADYHRAHEPRRLHAIDDGGAILGNSTKTDLSYTVRNKANVEAKKIIANLVCDLIEDGDHLMIDHSSTCYFSVKKLKGKKNLTVITNSVELASEICSIESWNVYMPGGQLRPESMALSGPASYEILHTYHVDKTLFSCKGIDMDETMLVTRLEAFGIPCLRQYPNDGQFGKLILGISGSGVDIFVPASVWEDACELIRESDDETEEEQ